MVKKTFKNPDQKSWKLSQQYLFFILHDCVRILTKILKNLEPERQTRKENVKILIVTVQTKILTCKFINQDLVRFW